METPQPLRIACDRSSRESRSNDRLYPSWSSSRFYHLSVLRDHIESIASTYLSERTNLALVDFGCGTQPYRPIFEAYGVQYVGVDLPENEKADICASPSGKTHLPENCADIVLSTQVLEHVDEPLEYLTECYRILKPSGLLILSTHGYWMYHPDPTDFWRWTSSGLRKIIQKPGFRLVECKGVMGLAPTAIQLLQDALMPKVPRITRPFFSLVVTLSMMLLDKLHMVEEKDRDACVFVVVASKDGE